MSCGRRRIPGRAWKNPDHYRAARTICSGVMPPAGESVCRSIAPFAAAALRKLAADAGLRDAVRFREPSGEVRRLLPTYDILVIPSRSESFGLVALEAYDASVPVIASDVPGLRKTVLDGKTGLLFESGSSTSLAAAVERLMQSEPLAGELIAGGKRYLQEYMPNDRLRSECREFYRKALLEDNRSGRPPYRFAGAGGAAAEPMKRRPESRRYVLRASTAASMLPRPD